MTGGFAVGGGVTVAAITAETRIAKPTEAAIAMTATASRFRFEVVVIYSSPFNSRRSNRALLLAGLLSLEPQLLQPGKRLLLRRFCAGRHGGLGAGFAAATLVAFGGNGSSIRSSPAPSVCVIGSPLSVIVTRHTSDGYLPGRASGVVFTLNATEVEPFVIFAGALVVPAGSPSNSTFASPAKSFCFSIFTT